LGNLLLLRLDQFEEWNFNADTDKIYAKLQCLHAHDGVAHIAAAWPFWGTLNFYRYTGSDALPLVANETNAGAETEVYVLDSTLNPTIVNSRQLRVVWRSKVSEAILAARGDLAARLEGSACF
jgi:hypothetical protein